MLFWHAVCLMSHTSMLAESKDTDGQLAVLDLAPRRGLEPQALHTLPA
jgi:hypothetical protein